MNTTLENVGGETAASIFAEEDPKVLYAYFLAFGIWTAAASNDFISPTWRSVGQTRRRGKLHVALAFIPMIFITVYVVFQHKTKDYKEMGAALLALAFAILHLGRTFMGLWQLHVFKQWTVSSIKSMKSLGYKAKLMKEEADDSDSDEPDDEDDGVLQWLIWVLQEANKRIQKKQGEIESIADKILVNDTLIDNRLSDVHTVCNFRLLSREENVTVKLEKSVFKRFFLRYRYRFLNTPRVLQVLFSLFLWKNPRVPKSKSGPRLVPRHPESVWLNWATALVAQVGWMLENNSHRDPNPSAGYAERRNWFAEQVLVSASLHTQRTTLVGSSTRMSGLLAFPDWHKYPELCKGKFSKQEWLKHACKTGNGLPYRVQHRRAKVTKDGVRRWGYSNFESELLRAREALPPELETRVANFDVERLEWFTIFVSVEDWAPWNSSTRKDDDLENRGDSGSDDSKSSPESIAEIEENKDEAENDVPIENLRKQLGFTKQPTFVWPFLPSVPKAILWGNRNVLEVSCHIDNWIALCAGKQTSYMLERVPWMELKLSLENAFRKGVTDGSASAGDNYCSIDQVVVECANFESCRYLCQMAIIRPELRHFDKSLTFLGCSMEMLRSSLAKYVETHTDSGEWCWKPPLSSIESLPTRNTKEKLAPFEGNKDFTLCLQSLRNIKDMSKTFVKMRVLWELQNHFHTYIQNNECTPSSREAIALCILSFPALSVTARCKRNASEVQRSGKGTQEPIEVVPGREECIVVVNDRDGERFRIENCEYVIRSSCGPQDLQLILSFEASEENSNINVSVVLCEIERRKVDYFDWEVWRNAFYGRLEGCRLWKQKVGILNFPLIAPSHHINAGVQKVPGSTTATIPGSGAGSEMCVWKGWLPHFASICMYEMCTEGFILQAREIQGVPFAVTTTADTSNILAIAQEIWEPVKYSDAKPASLKNASIVAHDLLCQRQGDVLSAQERTEIVMARKSDSASGSELRLLEVVAMQDRNMKALEKAIRILMNGKTPEAITRAVTLLERFYVFAKRGTCNLYLFWRNKEYVETVKSLFEEIFEISDYDRVVAERYRLFLLLLMRDGPKELRENTVSVILQSILHRCYSMTAAEATESVLSYCLSLHSSSSIEQVAVLVSAHSKAANEYDTCSLEFLQQTADMCLDVAVREIAKETGGMGALEDLLLSPHRMVELSKRIIERGSSNAMSRLGGILEQGVHGIYQDIPQAVELYTKAIEKDGHVGAVTRLAPLMKKAGPLAEKELPRVIKLYERLIEDRSNRHATNVLADFFSSGNLEDVPRAMGLYERAISEHQDAHAMNMLGNLHTRGDIGCQKDIARAADLYSRAIAEGNHIYAMYNLACLFSRGEESIARDIPGASDLLHRSIDEGGNFDAMDRLANMLVRGFDEIPKDVPRAVKLYSDAIDYGKHTDAMYNLAVLLCNGDAGVESNVPRAIVLLNRSIEEGSNIDAMYWLGQLLAWGGYGVTKDLPRAVELFSRAIDEGKHTSAMFKLAVLLSEGGEGIERDVPYAVQLLNHSIHEGNNFSAMTWLGNMLVKGGDVIQKDVAQAVSLFSRAIDEGNDTSAMYSLGVLLCQGEEGVERDLSRALNLLNRSVAEGSNCDAMHWLAGLYAWGEYGVEKDLPRAVELFSRAIDEGNHTYAMFSFAVLLCQGGEYVCVNRLRAVRLLNRAIAEGGNYRAMNWLANMLIVGGPDVQKDAVQAVQLYSRAIDEGNHTLAMYNLGVLLCKGEAGIEPDLPRAMHLLNRSIDEGSNFDAMHWLGELLAWGRYGVEKNLPLAVELFNRAINEGNHTHAMYSLAVLLRMGGEGIEQDVARAVHLLNRSIVEGNNCNAMSWLADMLVKGEDGIQKDVAQAVELFSRAVNVCDHTYAMYKLAILLCKGEDGVQRDVSHAVHLLNRSVEEGKNYDAMNLLGELLASGGYGLEKNVARAMELFSRAVDEGNHSYAMLNLGVLYCSGEGVEKDVHRGIGLLNQSIDEGGNVDAMNILAGWFDKGVDGVEKDLPRAIELYERAVNEGNHPFAMYNLGMLLCGDEEGVEPDIPRAADLFYRCANEAGDVDAMIKLGDLLQTGWDDFPMDMHSAIHFYEHAINEGHRVDAMHKLAVILQSAHEGVETDLPRAVDLYTRAINEGQQPESMVNLGILYETGGEGVARNMSRAVELYTAAIEEYGSGEAMERIASISAHYTWH